VSKLDREKLKYKAMGALWGGAIGDVMGLPVECKSPHTIRQLFGFVDEFVDNRHHNYKEVARRAKGTMSDDTQLPRAMMDSLIRRSGYDLDDIRQAHVEAYEGKWGKPVGWGKTTRQACEKIKEGHTLSYIPEAAGNGPCIKIGPLAIYGCFKTMTTPHGRFTNSFNASLLKKCREVTLISHGDPRCIVAAYCHARAIIRALQDEILPPGRPQVPQHIAKMFIEDAEYAEQRLNLPWPEDKPLSARLREILTTENFNRETYLVSIDICTHQSAFIYNSYPLVAYCVSKYLPYRNFRHAVTMTVNAGADADSNASMVGTIMGAFVGLHSLPPDLIKGIKGWRDLLFQIKKFVVSI
jgi:ADP-ribosylglycohydrolase